MGALTRYLSVVVMLLAGAGMVVAGVWIRLGGGAALAVAGVFLVIGALLALNEIGEGDRR